MDSNPQGQIKPLTEDMPESNEAIATEALLNDTTVLDEEELEQARARIQTKHPLGVIPLRAVFPFCGPCCWCHFKEKKKKINIFMAEECHEQKEQLEKIIDKYAQKPYVGTGKDDKYFG